MIIVKAIKLLAERGDGNGLEEKEAQRDSHALE
jgi:hypothetical protein